MISARKTGLGLAALFSAILVVPVLADGASDFQANTQKAQATLDQLATLLGSLGTHDASASNGAPQQVADTDGTLKCSVCGMTMTAKATDSNTKKVTIKGKDYYCCAGCDMSKIVDKPTRNRRNGARRRNP